MLNAALRAATTRATCDASTLTAISRRTICESSSVLLSPISKIGTNRCFDGRWGSVRFVSGYFRGGRTTEGHQRKETQYFGVEMFGGRRPTETNRKLIELPKPNFDPRPYKVHFAKYPGLVSDLGSEYYFRDGPKHSISYYHMKSPATGDQVLVGSTDQRLTESRTIDNYIKEKTRGFAVQIVLEGRGVKAYWEPKKPNLMVRLGVGSKVRDLTEYCKRDPDIDINVNAKGNVVVVHGPTKARVGTLAYSLLKKMQSKLQVYTGKGAHFVHHQERRKAMRKK